MKIQQFCMRGYRLMVSFLICMMLFCIYAAFFLCETWTYKPIILFVGTVIYALLVLCFYDFTTHISETAKKYLAAGMLIVFILGSLFIGQYILSARQADLFHLHNAAVRYLETGTLGSIDYFSVYPFQRNQTYVLIALYRLGEILGFTQYRHVGALYGTCMLSISAFLLYKTGCQLKNLNLGVSALFFFITNPVIYLYTSYYYTSLSAMPCFIGILYLALLAEKASGKKFIWLCFFSGIITHTAMQLRSTAGIISIAVLIAWWVVDWKKAIQATVYFLLGIVPSCIFWAFLTSKMGGELNPEAAFPITHWIMMGLNPANQGRWSGDMYSLTSSLATHSEKIEGNLQQIVLEFQEMGLSGLFNLLLTKVRFIWSDGMAGAIVNLSSVERYSNLYEYTVGTKRFVTCYIVQSMRPAVLIFLIPALSWFRKQKNMLFIAVPISLFGYALFHLFWEVHETYQVMFLPVLFLLSAVGTSQIYRFCRRFSSVTLERKQQLFSFVKKGLVVIEILSLLIALCSYREMTGEIDERYETRVRQSSSGRKEILSESVITQTFQLDQPFNEISIRFYREKAVPKDQQYQLSLENGGETLYQQTFSSESIKDNAYQKFNFQTVNSNGMAVYKLQLRALDACEENLQVALAGYNEKDYYELGECSIDGNLVDADLNFNVSEKFEGALMSKTVFFGLLFIVLALELLLDGWISLRGYELCGEAVKPLWKLRRKA